MSRIPNDVKLAEQRLRAEERRRATLIKALGALPSDHVWLPHEGPQSAYFETNAFEALFGGQAGGGKTDCLLHDAARQIETTGYNALLLRRTFPELRGAQGLISRSKVWYKRLGGKYNQTHHVWTFPAGSTIRFGHMKNFDDYHKYDSDQYQFIGADELGSFTEEQWVAMFARCRKDADNPSTLLLRGGTNPGASWLKRRFRAWLDKKYPNRAAPTEVRYYRRFNDVDEEVPRGTPGSRGRTFIPASFRDNPSLDPDYIRNLMQLPLVLRLRLMEGDWDIIEGRGNVINREWVQDKIVRALPEGSRRVRAWDFAATEEKRKRREGRKDTGPDWTATNLATLHEGKTYNKIDRQRISYSNVKKWVKSCADREPDVTVVIEQEPGSAGKGIVWEIVTMLQGRKVRVVRPTDNKVSRAQPWASQAEVGNVYLVESPGTEIDDVIAEFHNFPDGEKDDTVDVMSLAYGELTGMYGYNEEAEETYSPANASTGDDRKWDE